MYAQITTPSGRSFKFSFFCTTVFHWQVLLHECSCVLVRNIISGPKTQAGITGGAI